MNPINWQKTPVKKAPTTIHSTQPTLRTGSMKSE